MQVNLNSSPSCETLSSTPPHFPPLPSHPACLYQSRVDMLDWGAEKWSKTSTDCPAGPLSTVPPLLPADTRAIVAAAPLFAVAMKKSRVAFSCRSFEKVTLEQTDLEVRPCVRCVTCTCHVCSGSA